MVECATFVLAIPSKPFGTFCKQEVHLRDKHEEIAYPDLTDVPNWLAKELSRGVCQRKFLEKWTFQHKDQNGEARYIKFFSEVPDDSTQRLPEMAELKKFLKRNRELCDEWALFRILRNSNAGLNALRGDLRTLDWKRNLQTSMWYRYVSFIEGGLSPRGNIIGIDRWAANGDRTWQDLVEKISAIVSPKGAEFCARELNRSEGSFVKIAPNDLRDFICADEIYQSAVLTGKVRNGEILASVPMPTGAKERNRLICEGKILAPAVFPASMYDPSIGDGNGECAGQEEAVSAAAFHGRMDGVGVGAEGAEEFVEYKGIRDLSDFSKELGEMIYLKIIDAELKEKEKNLESLGKNSMLDRVEIEKRQDAISYHIKTYEALRAARFIRLSGGYKNWAEIAKDHNVGERSVENANNRVYSKLTKKKKEAKNNRNNMGLPFDVLELLLEVIRGLDMTIEDIAEDARCPKGLKEALLSVYGRV